MSKRNGGWTDAEALAAIAVERIDLWGMGQYVMAGAGRKGFNASKVPEPIRIPWPGTEPADQQHEDEDDVVEDPQQIAAWFATT